MILAGGLGTRLYPLTKIVSKQLLPVFDKPMIYYPLSTLMQLGIREVLIIATKQDVERFKMLLGNGSEYGMEITYAIQHSPEGIGHSFLLGEEFIGSDPVTLILGDNIIHSRKISSVFTGIEKTGATVFASQVENPTKYGVIEKDENDSLIRIIEKPKNPPSNLAVTGLYFYDENVVELTKSMQPSDRGEYEITDINNEYLKKGALNVKVFDDSVTWIDTGSFETLFAASEFVKNEQEAHGLVGSIEFEAYKNGWITSNKLEELASSCNKSGYSEKLLLSCRLSV